MGNVKVLSTFKELANIVGLGVSNKTLMAYNSLLSKKNEQESSSVGSDLSVYLVILNYGLIVLAYR